MHKTSSHFQIIFTKVIRCFFRNNYPNILRNDWLKVYVPSSSSYFNFSESTQTN